MLCRVFYLLSVIGGLVIPKPSVIRSSVSEFVGKRIDKYWKEECEREVFLSNELIPNPPIESCCDLVVYNNSGIGDLNYLELDDMFLKVSNSLKTLGIFALDIGDFQNSVGYKIVLEDPEELWNYNFVNVETDGNRILCRKGSGSVSKDRHLKKMIPYKIDNYKNLTLNENTTVKMPFFVINTGDGGMDYIVNTLSFIMQYMFLFNLLRFGVIIFLNTFVNNRY